MKEALVNRLRESLGYSLDGSLGESLEVSLGKNLRENIVCFPVSGMCSMTEICRWWGSNISQWLLQT